MPPNSHGSHCCLNRHPTSSIQHVSTCTGSSNVQFCHVTGPYRLALSKSSEGSLKYLKTHPGTSQLKIYVLATHYNKTLISDFLEGQLHPGRHHGTRYEALYLRGSPSNTVVSAYKSRTRYEIAHAPKDVSQISRYTIS